MNKKKSIIIILIGLVLLNSKNIYTFFMDKKISEVNKQFEDIDKEEIRENQNKDYDYDFDMVDYIKPNTEILDISDKLKESMIGKLKIDSVDIDLVLFEGISNDKLLTGVCTMKENQTLGEGNYAIAGHYGFNNKLLYNLNKVNIGDEIEITDKENIYIYEVVDKEIVNADRIDMIEDSRVEKYGHNIVSIMNCDYDNNKRTGKRLFVIGKLIDIKEY